LAHDPESIGDIADVLLDADVGIDRPRRRAGFRAGTDPDIQGKGRRRRSDAEVAADDQVFIRIGCSRIGADRKTVGRLAPMREKRNYR